MRPISIRLSFGRSIPAIRAILSKHKADVRDQAEERVKLNLILDEIVKAENIEVTDAEMEDEMKEIATYYNMPLEEVKKVLGGQEYVVKGDLTHRKALQLIKDNVK